MTKSTAFLTCLLVIGLNVTKSYAQSKYTFDELDSLLKTKEFTDTCHILDLNNMGLKEFPKNLVKCKNLVYLDLSGNGIAEIPNSIGDLKSLEIFYMNYSGLIKIPEGLYRCAKLKELFFYQSDVGVVPDGISKLQNLQIIHLGRTNICLLPLDIRQCRNLTDIILSNHNNEPCISDSLKMLYEKDMPNVKFTWGI